ncbi:MAG: protein-methionine-sulfoxide reductase catalytic subunit MsrP, partial [Verrucomicrobiota bacterium]|nr:protein-methionine-sulfoxide reductase catalytic subunit MsrP [Verrucomicrobiota bacterium]
LKQMGFVSAGLLAAPLVGCSKEEKIPSANSSVTNSSSLKSNAKYPAKRNPAFNPKWPLTNEKTAGTYNNFYEFSLDKEKVRELVGKFVTAPWPVQISGLIEKPMTLDVEEIIETAPLEERVYRFRCVEAWAMIVPWTGFPLSELIKKVLPKSEAKFLRFETANRPEQMPGIRRLPDYPWPYFEGLRMDEAMHPLTMVVTGIYGKPLPKQHGAPLRIIVPWKYGYKSIKSVVKIEFISKQPTTFWETLSAEEYPFESNVNPAIPHPRWSQATERIIDTGDRVKTHPFNGYGNEVAKLYLKS